MRDRFAERSALDRWGGGSRPGIPLVARAESLTMGGTGERSGGVLANLLTRARRVYDGGTRVISTCLSPRLAASDSIAAGTIESGLDVVAEKVRHHRQRTRPPGRPPSTPPGRN